MKFWTTGILLVLLAGCGSSSKTENRDIRDPNPPAPAPTPTYDPMAEIDTLKKQVLALLGTQNQITSFIASDFDTCPTSGDTVDPLIRQICKAAQSANATQILDLKSELASVNEITKDQLNAINDNIVQLQTQESSDVSTINASITSINSQITTINSSLTTLTTNMTNAQSAISALQTLTNSINSTMTGLIANYEIGTENAAAGPLYETVERRVDKTRINAYVESYGANVSLPNNCATSISGSATVTISATSHGFAVGNVVHMTGIQGGNGFANGDVTGDFVVNTVPNSNSFTVVLRKNATSNGTFGGSTGLPIAYLVQGRGLGTVWVTANGADAAVRTTTLGTQRYNWIVKADGSICYDKTVAAQTFSVISAFGANIVCK